MSLLRQRTEIRRRCIEHVGAGDRARRIDSNGFTGDDTVETINLGERGDHTLALTTHKKTKAVLQRLKCRPEQTVYSATWLADGWDGKSPIRRVEMRGAGRALRLRPKTGALGLDLVNPANLLESGTLRQFWRHTTEHRFRLVVPPARRNDLRHQPVDPRWEAVQQAGGEGGMPRLFVDQSEVCRLHLAALRRRRARELVRTLATCVGLADEDDLQIAMRDVIEEVMKTQAFEQRVAAERERRDRLRAMESPLAASPMKGTGHIALA
jgi:hypothetical protein